MNITDIGYLLNNYWSFFLQGLVATICLSIVGTVGGLFLGVFLAFGEGIHVHYHDKWYQKVWRYIVIWICRIYSVVIRGTPMMVQAIIFKYACQGMGLNWNLICPQVQIFNGWFWAGIIVITFNTAAYMGEIVKAGLNGVDKGQTEGAKSLGMSNFQTLFLVTLPQAIRNSLPTIGNEWIVNIKDSSVLNVIGVAELYFMSGQAANKNYMTLAAFIIVACIYLLLTLCTTGILKVVELKLDHKQFKVSFFHFRNQKGA